MQLYSFPRTLYGELKFTVHRSRPARPTARTGRFGAHGNTNCQGDRYAQ